MEVIFGLEPVYFWFLLGVICFVLEVMTPGFFLLFFGFGAWFTGGLVFFLPDVNQSLQWITFMVVSIITLVILRQKMKLLFLKTRPQAEILDDPVISNLYIGREVEVFKEIKHEEPGLVELNGTNWQARSNGQTITPGQWAKVVGMDGLTLIVDKSEKE